jgi:hypothetical protein
MAMMTKRKTTTRRTKNREPAVIREPDEDE